MLKVMYFRANIVQTHNILISGGARAQPLPRGAGDLPLPKGAGDLPLPRETGDHPLPREAGDRPLLKEDPSLLRRGDPSPRGGAGARR